MGELIERSNVPKWAWSIILTSFLALMSFTIGASAGNQKIKDNIETNREDIQELKKVKASAEKVVGMDEEVDRIFETVVRIENKLDQHISKDN